MELILTSNQYNPYFRCAIAPTKYHTVVLHVYSSHSFTRSVEYYYASHKAIYLQKQAIYTLGTY